jgi:hypothetical protein
MLAFSSLTVPVPLPGPLPLRLPVLHNPPTPIIQRRQPLGRPVYSGTQLVSREVRPSFSIENDGRDLNWSAFGPSMQSSVPSKCLEVFIKGTLYGRRANNLYAC